MHPGLGWERFRSPVDVLSGQSSQRARLGWLFMENLMVRNGGRGHRMADQHGGEYL